MDCCELQMLKVIYNKHIYVGKWQKLSKRITVGYVCRVCKKIILDSPFHVDIDELEDTHD